MGGLGVQGVEGDHGVGQIESREQRLEDCDFVRPAVHLALGGEQACIGYRGEQVDLRAIGGSLSTRWRTRRMVASAGGVGTAGSRTRPPSAAMTAGGASAAHSVIADSDIAPASTAHAASPRTKARG